MKPSNVQSRAFTLVELMISLGIALLLIYGINLVFRAVTDTVRVGNALAAATRKMRSVDSSLTIDFEGTYSEINPLTNVKSDVPTIERRWSGIVPVVGNIDPTTPANYETEPRQPAITIFCKRQFAFLNKSDKENDADGQPQTEDESDTGTITDFSAAGNIARLGRRAHRTDTIGFFTGGSIVPASLRGTTASGSASQAWVWYGPCCSSAGRLRRRARSLPASMISSPKR
ncbi:MAG: prepilin-type N-terminal cleavage/methylation domain-containing protein [Tepidisphaeraceae bacterium]